MNYRFALTAFLLLTVGACIDESDSVDASRDSDTGTHGDAAPIDATSEEPDGDVGELDGSGQEPDADAVELDGDVGELDGSSGEMDAGIHEPDGAQQHGDAETLDARTDASAEAAVDAASPGEAGTPDPWGSASAWTDEDTQAAFAYRCGVNEASDGDVVLDVGYTRVEPMGLALHGDRLLIKVGSNEASPAGWSLWKRSDRTRVAHGDGRLLAHSTQVFATSEGGNLVLRSMLDAHALLTRTASEVGLTGSGDETNWSGGLARDGSYYWYYSSDGHVHAADMDGTQWLDAQPVAGGLVNAQPTLLTVVDGGNTLRGYPRSGGASTTVSVPGAGINSYPRFSLDGSRFFVHTGSTVRLYERNGTFVGENTVGSTVPAGSTGDWLWVVNYAVSLYRVGNDTPVLSFPNVYIGDRSGPWAASASRLVLPGHVVDLTTGTELQTATPSPRNTNAIAADGTDWVTHGYNARLADVGLIAEEGVRGPDGEFFGCGSIRNIVVGENGLAFVTTERGVFVLDVATRSMRGFVRTHVSTVQGAQIAEDGSVLLLSDGPLQENFAVFSIDPASGAAPRTVDVPEFLVPADYVRLSQNGHWVGVSGGALFSLDTPPVAWGSSVGNGAPYPNPSSTRVATTTSTGPQAESWNQFPIYDRSGTLLGWRGGAPMKWLSDDVLISGNERDDPTLRAINATGGSPYPGVTCPGDYRGLSRIQRLGGTMLYLPSHGQRCDIATGQTSSVPPYRGRAPEALFGDRAVYFIGTQAAVRSIAP